MSRKNASKGLRVVVQWGAEVRSTRLGPGASVVLGRDPACDLCLDNPQWSRRHAALHLSDAGQLSVEDLGSRNGTFVLREGSLDTTQLEQRVPARDRQGISLETLVQLGHALVRVEPEATSEDDGPDDRHDHDDRSDAIVEDPKMVALYRLARRVASSQLTVLIEGESGVGKEVLAHYLHARSPRADKPLLAINCGAIPKDLLESELFGHEAGAFTGATKAQRGLLEAANGGTLFLDEVGELSLELQVKFLRVLESSTILRVGGREPIKVDVRYVAATNRRLSAEVEQGRFREDLYYRLTGISLAIPPLRERASEILRIARRFLGEHRLTADAQAAVLAYPWPGNVRQLKNVMERAKVLADGDLIEAEHLHLTKVITRSASPAPASASRPAAPALTSERPGDSGLRDTLNEYEREQIVAALEANAGNQTRAAKALGMTRRELTGRLKRYGIPRPRD
ncbi:MAG: sigma 54-dependent Fis family transcriptional regulator [Kofleriaceae bacterium]